MNNKERIEKALMETCLDKQDLIDFETDIAKSFLNKEIRSPIHLNAGNENQMLQIFKHVQPEDYCVGTWRTHYMCLLKGVGKERLKQEILNGRSISLCFKDHNIISSAIVGGSIAIATGIALDIKRKHQKNKVWCFLGDMGSTTGIFHECHSYSFNNDLPITYIIEDNGKSVLTDTKKVWNTHKLMHEPPDYYFPIGWEDYIHDFKNKIWYYKYKLDKYPHAGSGQRIEF